MSCEPENCLGPSLAQEAQLHSSDGDASWLQSREDSGLLTLLRGTKITRGQHLDWAVFWEGELPTGRGLCCPILLANCYHQRIIFSLANVC